MRGFDLHHYLTGSTFVNEGWTPGLLVEVGRYPGLVEGDGRVAGELYALRDAPAMLEALDELEDFDPTNPQASIYLRALGDVHVRDGATARAWLYRYNCDPSKLAVVKSGDWRKRS